MIGNHIWASRWWPFGWPWDDLSRSDLRWRISRKPSVVERNGARFGPQGVICKWVKYHFGRFETFVAKIPYYHSPEITIADISETVARRPKRSSIWTPRGNVLLVRCHFDHYGMFVTKIPYYHSPEIMIADISKTVACRPKQSSIWTPKGQCTTGQMPFWPLWEFHCQNSLLSLARNYDRRYLENRCL